MVNLETIRRNLSSVSGRLLTGTSVIHIVLIPILLWTVYTLSSESLKQQFVSNARSSAGLLVTTLAPVDPIATPDIMIDLLDEIPLPDVVELAPFQPFRIRQIARRIKMLRLLMGGARKTDRDDALKLAQLSAMNQLPVVHLPAKDVRERRSLIQFRGKLVGRRTRIKNHIRSILAYPRSGSARRNDVSGQGRVDENGGQVAARIG